MENTTKKIFAQVETKSNWFDLNGHWLEVFEMVNDRVTCLVEMYGKLDKVDFNLKEIKGFKFNRQLHVNSKTI